MGGTTATVGTGPVDLSTSLSAGKEVDDLSLKVDTIQSQLDTLLADNVLLKEKVASLENNTVILDPDRGSMDSRLRGNDNGTSGNDIGVGTSAPVINDNTISSASTVLAEVDSLLDGQTATLSALTVSDLARFNDVNIIGSLSAGFLNITGLDLAGGSDIDTDSGPLRLQSTAQNELEIMNGKVIVDTEGNIKTTGSITASEVRTNKLTIDSRLRGNDNGVSGNDILTSSLGRGILKKGEKKIVIETTAVTANSEIFITPKALIDYPLVVTGKTEGESFTVEIKIAEDIDTEFSWFIIN